MQKDLREQNQSGRQSVSRTLFTNLLITLVCVTATVFEIDDMRKESDNSLRDFMGTIFFALERSLVTLKTWSPSSDRHRADSGKPAMPNFYCFLY